MPKDQEGEKGPAPRIKKMSPLYLIPLIQVLIGCRTPAETSAKENRPSGRPLCKTRRYATCPRDEEGYAPGARKNRLYEMLIGHTGSHAQEPIKLTMQLLSDPPTLPRRPATCTPPWNPDTPRRPYKQARRSRVRQFNKRPRRDYFSEIPLQPEARRGLVPELPLQLESLSRPCL